MSNVLKTLPVVISSALILSMLQIKMDNPMLILERFVTGGGWIEIALLSVFGGFLYLKMIDPKHTKKWRVFSWTLFSVVFFLQLILGIAGVEEFLMTGKLHLPVPAVIIGGSLYRFDISFMPILLMSTIVLTGPAWCSQLCYFGAFDYLAASSKKRTHKWAGVLKYRAIFFALFIISVIVLRVFNIEITVAAWLGGVFGILGVVVVLLLSRKKGSMLHCVSYCPVGFLVSVLKYVNPFRMYIDNNCDKCMACVSKCRYYALSKSSIDAQRLAISCTYCGDCISACHTQSIKYRLFNLPPDKARKVYLGITLVVYVVFLATARI